MKHVLPSARALAAGAAIALAGAPAAAEPLTLTWADVVRLAGEHPRVREADVRAAAAAARVSAARAIPNPSLDVALGRGSPRDRPGEAKLEQAYELSLPLEWLAQRGPRLDAARASLEEAKAEALAQRRDALGQLGALFWNVAFDQARVESLQLLEAQASQVAKLVGLRVEKGEARPIELPRAETEVASLAVALTAVPALSELILRQAPEKGFGAIRRLHQGYLRLLDGAVRRPRLTLAASFALLLGAGALAPFVGTEFMPPLDEGSLAVNVVRLPNAALDGSVKVSEYLERRLRRFPEIETVVSKTGRAEISEDPMGPEQTDLFIMLKPRGRWGTGRDKAELTRAIQEDLAQVPGLRFSFSQPIALRVNELISGVKSDVAVKVFGPDLDALKQYADRAAAALMGVRGAQDVKVEQISGMSQIDAEIDREAVARYGINVSDVNDTLETAIAGRRATTLIEGQRRFAVVVRFPEAARADVPEIERLLIAAPRGERVPLGQLAKISTVEAPAQVSRENGMRRVVVEANVRGRDLGGFVAEVQAGLAQLQKELPPGTFIEIGGQFENQQRAMRQLQVVVPVALLLILILLTMALGSVGNSLLVLLNLPFALVGGVVAVVLFRMPLSVSAAVAFIVLLGVAVQNGVVLVAFFSQLRQRGESVAEAVRKGCELRFRPLLMTALTSLIGHLPMLYATGSGADIQKPLAVVVMGGLVTSTALTLLVLPTVYSMLAGRAERRDGARVAGDARAP